MSSPLPSRRKVVVHKWSPKTEDVIRNPMKFDDFVDEEREIPKTSRKRRQVNTPKQHRDPYEVNKKAFLVHQQHQADMIRKYQKQMDRTELQIRKAEKASQRLQKKPEPIRRIKDNHILEGVINRRNDEYIEGSEYVPQGFVTDINSSRKLVPDNKLYVKTGNRCFYWG